MNSDLAVRQKVRRKIGKDGWFSERKAQANVLLGRRDAMGLCEQCEISVTIPAWWACPGLPGIRVGEFDWVRDDERTIAISRLKLAMAMLALASHSGKFSDMSGQNVTIGGLPGTSVVDRQWTEPWTSF